MANGYGIAIIKSKIKVKRKKTGIKKEEAGLQEISQSQNSYFNQFQQQFQEIQIQEKYQGQWKNDAPHGNGKHIMKDGSIYQGNFKNGIKSGSGRYQLSKSSNNASTKFQSHNRKTVLYEGQFLDNMFHGEGVLNWESQQKSSQQEFQHQSLYLMKLKYIGQWKYGKMNGQGKLYYPDKSFYEGNFRENLREGHGKYVYADGRSWVGQWSDNRQNGRGVYIKPRKTLNKVQKNDKNNKNQGQFEQIHGIWKDGIQIPVSYDVSQVNIQVQ